MIRLQKYIANSGICSRRRAEELMLEGKVAVNGRIVTEMGTKVSDSDVVEVEGKRILPETKKIYVLLNKPRGYITTMSEQFGRPMITDLLKEIPERVYPVGRLDMDTTGLILMTNDGDLANYLAHPTSEIKKTYAVTVAEAPKEENLNRLREGVLLGDKVTAPAQVSLVKMRKQFSVLHITIHEGRNRQVRRMFEAIGHEVLSLERIQYAFLTLDGVAVGEWRYLTEEEIKQLHDEKARMEDKQ